MLSELKHLLRGYRGPTNASLGADMALFPPDIYCCDADALIDLHSAGLLRKLRILAQNGKLWVPEGVFAELRRFTNKLAAILASWDSKYGIVVRLNHNDLSLLPRLEREYGPPFRLGGRNYAGFWASASGRRAKDAQVVAVAKTRGWTVVSNDDSIHGACMLEKVPCRRWEEIGRLLL